MERNNCPNVFPSAFMRQSSLIQMCEITNSATFLWPPSVDLLVSVGQGAG